MSIVSTAEKIVWKARLRSTPEHVYRLLATDDGRERFWCESSTEAGDLVHMTFVNGMETRGRVLERRPPRRFALEYFDAKVVFELEETPVGGTDLTMVNTEFPPSDFAELLAGWLNVLFPLKAVADFGVDLRSHDSERTWELGYIDQ